MSDDDESMQEFADQFNEHQENLHAEIEQLKAERDQLKALLRSVRNILCEDEDELDLIEKALAKI